MFEMLIRSVKFCVARRCVEYHRMARHDALERVDIEAFEHHLEQSIKFQAIATEVRCG